MPEQGMGYYFVPGGLVQHLGDLEVALAFVDCDIPGEKKSWWEQL